MDRGPSARASPLEQRAVRPRERLVCQPQRRDVLRQERLRPHQWTSEPVISTLVVKAVMRTHTDPQSGSSMDSAPQLLMKPAM
jgi:hypothetical protein